VTTLEVEAEMEFETERFGEPEDEEAAEEAGQKRPSGWLREVGLILTVLGLSLLLFYLYVFSFTDLQEARAQRQLLNVFTTPAGSVPLSGKLPPVGAPAAVLSIPSIGVHAVVVQGTTSSQTARGPGLMTQAARPGTIGNAVIIGRKLTSGAAFKDLGLLKKGSTFTVASGLGEFHYVVTKTGVALPGQLDPVSPVNKAQLTLVTADQPLSSSKMYYVVARQKNPPGAAKRPTERPTTRELGFAGDPSALRSSVLLGLLYAFGVVATVLAYRRYRQHLWTVYVLSTPILLAIALWWFENLYRLLPATL
jgi:sortase A